MDITNTVFYIHSSWFLTISINQYLHPSVPLIKPQWIGPEFTDALQISVCTRGVLLSHYNNCGWRTHWHKEWVSFLFLQAIFFRHPLTRTHSFAHVPPRLFSSSFPSLPFVQFISITFTFFSPAPHSPLFHSYPCIHLPNLSFKSSLSYLFLPNMSSLHIHIFISIHSISNNAHRTLLKTPLTTASLTLSLNILSFPSDPFKVYFFPVSFYISIKASWRWSLCSVFTESIKAIVKRRIIAASIIVQH